MSPTNPRNTSLPLYVFFSPREKLPTTSQVALASPTGKPRFTLSLCATRLLLVSSASPSLQRPLRAVTIVPPVTRSSRRRNMSDPAALANVFQDIATILQTLTAAQAAAAQAQPAPPPPLGHNAVLQLFDTSTPFDLSSRSGSAAMAKASSALGSTWDGSIDKLPPFLTALKTRAREAKWNAPAPYGILLYLVNGTSVNLLSDFHSVPESTIDTDRLARTDPRAIQNSRAMFFALSASIDGDLQNTIFTQDGNIPDIEDGPLLFKRMLHTTVAASSQVSMQALRDLQDLNPCDYSYNISIVNTRAAHLFTLATTGARILSDGERIQLLLTAYNRIRQPAAWATWVANKTEAFDAGLLVPSNHVSAHILLMNDAVLKSNRLHADKDNGSLHWRSTSLEEDVVAMLSKPVTTNPPVTPPSKFPRLANTPGTATPPKSSSLPPFARHFKSSPAPDAPKFVVGDSKPFNGTTWFFCDCPNHRNKVKWHTFPHTECRQRQRWLETNPPPSANLSELSTISNPTHPSLPPNHLTTLLADALHLANDDDPVYTLIAQALNATHQA